MEVVRPFSSVSFQFYKSCPHWSANTVDRNLLVALLFGRFGPHGSPWLRLLPQQTMRFTWCSALQSVVLQLSLSLPESLLNWLDAINLERPKRTRRWCLWLRGLVLLLSSAFLCSHLQGFVTFAYGYGFFPSFLHTPSSRTSRSWPQSLRSVCRSALQI